MPVVVVGYGYATGESTSAATTPAPLTVAKSTTSHAFLTWMAASAILDTYYKVNGERVYYEPTCGILSGCYLQDTTSDEDILLLGPSTSVTSGHYNMVCEMVCAVDGDVDSVKFTYDGYEHVEYRPPYRKQDITLVCGCDHNQVTVVGYLDSKECFRETYGYSVQ